MQDLVGKTITIKDLHYDVYYYDPCSNELLIWNETTGLAWTSCSFYNEQTNLQSGALVIDSDYLKRLYNLLELQNKITFLGLW